MTHTRDLVTRFSKSWISYAVNQNEKHAIMHLEILVYSDMFNQSELMIQYMKESLAHKLKRERVEACLNCKRFAKCDGIGRFVECVDFEEIEGEAWVIERLGGFSEHGLSMKETPSEAGNPNDD
jgi:hypothetical protein